MTCSRCDNFDLFVNEYLIFATKEADISNGAERPHKEDFRIYFGDEWAVVNGEEPD